MLRSAEPAQRAQFMAGLIKDYGIDINALDEALVSQSKAPNVDKQVRALLDQELAPFRMRAAEEQRMQQEEVARNIAAMEADTASYPLFDQVRDDMADLIEIKAARGVYISIKQAYSLLTGSSPAVTAANRQTKIANDAATAAKAKIAASSIGGVPGSVNSAPDPTNLRGTIEAAYGDTGGRI